MTNESSVNSTHDFVTNRKHRYFHIILQLLLLIQNILSSFQNSLLDSSLDLVIKCVKKKKQENFLNILLTAFHYN